MTSEDPPHIPYSLPRLSPEEMRQKMEKAEKRKADKKQNKEQQTYSK